MGSTADDVRSPLLLDSEGPEYLPYSQTMDTAGGDGEKKADKGKGTVQGRQSTQKSCATLLLKGVSHEF